MIYTYIIYNYIYIYINRHGGRCHSTQLRHPNIAPATLVMAPSHGITDFWK